MKFSISRDSLFEAVQKVQSVVEKKNTIQILGNILCIAEKEKISLCATDLEVGVKVTIPAEIKEEGKVTLSAKHFTDIVKELPSEPLWITKKQNDWVEILSGKSRFNVVSLSADEYPQLPPFEEKKYHQAHSERLAEMIQKTSFAVSTDATRYHLNGVFFEKLDNQLMRMTATDGHRLSYIDHEVFLEMPEMKRGMIIPKKGLGELRKLLSENSENETIGISFDRSHFFAQSGNTYLFVRLIEGEYPDYKQVIPKETTNTIQLNREDFLAAVKRVSLLAHEKSRGIKLQFKENQVIINSSNPDMGEATEELDVEYQGDEVDIGFNAKYLLDCLPVIQSSTLEFKFKDRLSPGILQGVDQRNHSYIIMPMRI